ncbi:MAG: hypothetical protein EOP04_03935 [Proteobacteria bacterium]|nr:MAG: hypothetical protein EOP04_03935 [Pseudomonadota bacterium]
MNDRIKKSPTEYPMFAVRITAEQKEQLHALTDIVRESLNRVNKPNEKLWMKNDVVYEALMLGLPLLKESADRKE